MSEQVVTVAIQGAREFWDENADENIDRFTELLDKYTAELTGEPYTPFVVFENHSGFHEVSVTFDIESEDRVDAVLLGTKIMTTALVELKESSPTVTNGSEK
jgi:hypothetical protein